MGVQHEGYVFNFNGTHPTIFLLADVRGALLGISEIDGRRNLEKGTMVSTSAKRVVDRQKELE
jgi:hypothetical protein